jgi:transcriptional regulator with XRE-family HTH domain
MQISERIKKIRKKTELSQAVFSESLGVTMKKKDDSITFLYLTEIYILCKYLKELRK